ncbi:probable cyclin-dependent serine/threonine-protein kinase DDB_G0292550 [Paramacrobiotus metropolitanus]|uniref:probable cyclin-dependent serine/threonine-protein kinase DDB_G0292550 n=1 Tax=Paramacrobiotus metropolitanus TaxID=2943436 RepID=UPI002446522E|nr:probable cyclin-dependent serine/threonine-protein kinase DDB_G0292550 [Paramacrobiotus metropolitanus]
MCSVLKFCIFTGLLTFVIHIIKADAKAIYADQSVLSNESGLSNGNFLIYGSRYRRGITDSIKGLFGFGNNNNNNNNNNNQGSSNDGNQPQPPNTGNTADSGSNSNGNNGSPPPAVREGPSRSGDNNGDRQSITGNKWIDTAISAFRGSGDNSGSISGDSQKSVGGRIVDALAKEAMKSLFAGLLGG